VHPWRAIAFGQRLLRLLGEPEARTESVDNVASELARCAKYSRSMAYSSGQLCHGRVGRGYGPPRDDLEIAMLVYDLN
jgi:hypothetical protein